MIKKKKFLCNVPSWVLKTRFNFLKKKNLNNIKVHPSRDVKTLVNIQMGGSRAGIEDVEGNNAIRFFFHTSNLPDLNLVKGKKLTKTTFGKLQDFLKEVCLITQEYYEESGIENNTAKVAVLYYNPDEEILSIILTFQLNKNDSKLKHPKIKIGNLRYYLSKKFAKYNLNPFLTNDYNVHLPIGEWDSFHAFEKPKIVFNSYQIKEFSSDESTNENDSQETASEEEIYEDEVSDDSTNPADDSINKKNEGGN